MATEIVPCNDGCKIGWMDPNRSVTVKMPKVDAEGKPVLNSKDEPTYVYMKRVYHILAPSRLAEYPLVPVSCGHGVLNHPDPEQDAWGKGRGHSWVKSGYVMVDGLCVLDHGATERPADLTCGLT